jgi:TolA-binding protein
MRHASMVVLLITATALVLAGCGDFRQRAAEAEDRITTAEQAAAQNTARILDLEDRIEALEQQMDELHQEAGTEAGS